MKITVIATASTEKALGRSVSPASLQTPVDLSSYTAHLSRMAEPGGYGQPVPSHQGGNGPYAPSLAVNRRPGLDLSQPMAATGGGVAAAGASPEGKVEFNSKLDVPAFLRRQG